MKRQSLLLCWSQDSQKAPQSTAGSFLLEGAGLSHLQQTMASCSSQVSMTTTKHLNQLSYREGKVCFGLGPGVPNTRWASGQDSTSQQELVAGEIAYTLRGYIRPFLLMGTNHSLLGPTV